jgi:hypothetical protein
MLSLFFTVGILSLIFWLFPAIRQFKTDLFFYFLILAIMDPFVMIARLSPVLIMYNVYVIFSFIMLLIFVYIYKKRIYFYSLTAIAVVLSVFTFFLSTTFCYDLMIISHIGILFFLIRRALFYVNENSKVNFFQLVLILYETSIVVKILAMFTNAELGPLYHLITTIFEIFIAIFFTIFKEDNPKLIFSIKSSNQIDLQ